MRNDSFFGFCLFVCLLFVFLGWNSTPINWFGTKKISCFYFHLLLNAFSGDGETPLSLFDGVTKFVFLYFRHYCFQRSLYGSAWIRCGIKPKVRWPMERPFARDVTATIFVNVNKKMAAILADQNIPSRIVFNFYLFASLSFVNSNVTVFVDLLFTSKGRQKRYIWFKDERFNIWRNRGVTSIIERVDKV